jgi:phospholipid N-methyltransferase
LKLRFWSDVAKFLIESLRHPCDTAAIAPSGRALASLITREIDGASGPILELGPGTGVFTRALTCRGVVERDLTLVEQSPSFARLLKDRFPASTVLNINAAQLHRSRESAAQPFGAVVCGLGLRNMTSLEVEGIVRASFAVLQPTASFYLFTYGGRCSVPKDVLDRLGLIAEKVGSTLRNLPPASVYRLRRAETVR